MPAGGIEDALGRRRGLRQGHARDIAQARTELAGALQDPAGALAAKVASRDALSKWSQVSLPGDPVLQDAIDWGKQNLADVTQTASDLQIRWTNQGKQFPPPARNGRSRPLVRRRLPRLPVDLRHRRRVHELRRHGARASSRSPRTTCARCATSPTSSTTARGSSSTRPCPTARSGSATTRRRPRPTARRPTTSTPTRRSSSRARSRYLALDRRQPLPRRDVRLRQAQPPARRSATRRRPRRLAGGLGQRRADRAWAPRSSTTASTTSARSTTSPTWRAPSTTARPRSGPRSSPASSSTQFEGTWWDTPPQQYADSLDNPGNVQNFQKHWIGQVPMEAELQPGRQATPGVASDEPRHHRARRPRELVLQRRPAGSRGPLPHRLRRRRRRQGRLRDLLADDLDPGHRRGQLRTPRPRPAAALHRRERRDDGLRARHGRTPDEQPGAMPEIFPSSPTAPHRASRRTSTAAGRAARCSCRRGATTARRGRSSTSSSACARSSTTACSRWSRRSRRPAQRGGIEHQARARLGRRVRLALGRRLHARRSTRRAPRCDELLIGHTLPRGSKPADVRLDGRRVKHYDARETNRGLEVTVAAQAGSAAHADDRDEVGAVDPGQGPPARAGPPQAAETTPAPASTRAASTRLCTPRRP